MNKKVLVIDDDPGIQDIFSLILRRAGYLVEILDDVRWVFSHRYEVPDIFLVDKHIGGSDGVDICNFLKTNGATSHIPVIMVSAHPDISSLYRIAGADDYIEKPFEISDLVNKIRKYTGGEPFD